MTQLVILNAQSESREVILIFSQGPRDMPSIPRVGLPCSAKFPWEDPGRPTQRYASQGIPNSGGTDDRDEAEQMLSTPMFACLKVS